MPRWQKLQRHDALIHRYKEAVRDAIAYACPRLSGKPAAPADQPPAAVEALEPRLLLSANNSISGTVFADTDGDAYRDATEVGFENIRVFIDSIGNNGTYDSGELYDITDSNGDYLINPLVDGNHRVVAELPATSNWSHTLPDDGIYESVAVSGDQVTGDIDFGIKTNMAMYTSQSDPNPAEGSPITFFFIAAGLDNPSWTIQWDDGKPDSTPTSGIYTSTTHTYDDGTVTYTVTATATDATTGLVFSQEFPIEVVNVSPIITLTGDSTVGEHDIYYLTIDTVDNGINDTIQQWEVDWGDGSPIDSVQASGTSNNETITLIHEYDSLGTYNIEVRAQDSDGHWTASGDLNNDGFIGLGDIDIVLAAWNETVPPGDVRADPSGDGYVGLEDLDIVLRGWNLDTFTKEVEVTDVPPAGMNISGSPTIDVGRAYRLNLSATANSFDGPLDYWTITWGDGSDPQVVSGSATYVEHIYTKPYDPATITATLTDGQGTYNVGHSVEVTVRGDVDPVINSESHVRVFTPGVDYAYKIDAFSPIGETLTYSMTVTGLPSGINAPVLDTSTGWITWASTESSGYGTTDESFTIDISVTDGTNTATDSFDVYNSTYTSFVFNDDTGQISGTIYNDLNQNGIQDFTLTPSATNDPLDIVFVIDRSQTTLRDFDVSSHDPVPMPGDMNGDGDKNTILDSELRAFQALVEQLQVTHPGSRIGFIDFARSYRPNATVYTETGANTYANLITALKNIDAVQNPPYGTNYKQALIGAKSYFDGPLATGSNQRVIVFLSDGHPNVGKEYQAVLADLKTNYNVAVRAFGAGNFTQLSKLQELDPQAAIFQNYAETYLAFDGLVIETASYTEPGLAGWDVYIDMNRDGDYDAGTDILTTTDSEGRYTFTGLDAGTYEVRAIIESGYVFTNPADGDQLVNLIAIEDDTAGDTSVDQVSKIDFAVIDEPNGAPYFVSTHKTDANVGEEYEYPVVAFDDTVGDTVTLSVSGPDDPGFVMDENGVITWTPTADHAGKTYTITLTATDGINTITDTYDLLVHEAENNQAPYITNAADESFVIPNADENPAENLDPGSIRTHLDDGESNTYTITLETPDTGVNTADVMVIIDPDASVFGGSLYYWNHDWIDKLDRPNEPSWVELLDAALEDVGLANNRYALSVLDDPTTVDVVQTVGSGYFGSTSDLITAIADMSLVSNRSAAAGKEDDSIIEALETYYTSGAFRSNSAKIIIVIGDAYDNTATIDQNAVSYWTNLLDASIHVVKDDTFVLPTAPEVTGTTTNLFEPVLGDWEIRTEGEQDLIGAYCATPSESSDLSISLAGHEILYHSVDTSTSGGDLVDIQPVDTEVFFSVSFPDREASERNAYYIYDYVSPDNFKFAGIDEVAREIQIGRKIGDQWIVDASESFPLPTTEWTYTLGFVASNDILGPGGVDLSVTNPEFNLGEPLAYYYEDELLQRDRVGKLHGLATRGAEAEFSEYHYWEWLNVTSFYDYETLPYEVDGNPIELYTWIEDRFIGEQAIGIDAEANGAYRAYVYDLDGNVSEVVVSQINDLVLTNHWELVNGQSWRDLAWNTGGGVWAGQLLSHATSFNQFSQAFATGLAQSEARRLFFNDGDIEVQVDTVNLGSADVFKGATVTDIRREIIDGQARAVIDLEIELEGLLDNSETGYGLAHDLDLTIVDTSSSTILATLPVRIGMPYVYEMQGYDPDDPEGTQTLTYRFKEGTDTHGAKIDGNRMTWDPQAAGDYTFTVEVVDEDGGIGEREWTVSVTEAGYVGDSDNIVIETIGTIEVEAGRSPQFQVNAHFEDHDTNPGVPIEGVDLTYYLRDNNAGTGREGDLHIRVSEDGVITIDPKPTIFNLTNDGVDDPLYSFTLVVQDNRGGRQEQTFYVDVVTPTFNNESPEFDDTVVPLATIEAGQHYETEVAATDSDLDLLTFEKVSGPRGLKVDPDGTIYWMPETDDVGVADVVVRVKDGRGGIDVKTYQIEVTPPNRAPVILSTPGEVARVGGLYLYQLRAFDWDGDEVEIDLALSDLPTGMSIATGDDIWGIPVTEGLIQFIPTTTGTVNVNLAISDGDGGVTYQSFSIDVSAAGTNAAPVFDTNHRTEVTAGAELVYVLNATDENGDAIEYDITFPAATVNTPVWDEATRTLTWTPDVTEIGSDFTFIAKYREATSTEDGIWGPVNVVFTVVGDHTNQAPQIESRQIHGASADKLYTIDFNAEDPDGDPYLWSLASRPDGMIIDPLTGLVLWTPTADDVGVHEVIVRAMDYLGESSTFRYLLPVRGTASKPRFLSSPVAEAQAGQPYTYVMRVEDPDDDATTLIYDVNQAWLEVVFNDDGNPVLQVLNEGTVPTGIEEQLTPIEVTATDADGNTATHKFNLIVSSGSVSQGPSITSQPYLYAVAGDTYTYDVVAINMPGGNYTVEADTTSFDDTTLTVMGNQVSWNTSNLEAGKDYGLWVTATDSVDTTVKVRQYFEVRLEESNHTPTLGSAVTLNVAKDQTYIYDVLPEDADGDKLTFAFDQTVPFTMDDFGRITISSSTEQTVTFKVIVTDQFGASAEQDFTVNVVNDQSDPTSADITTVDGRTTFKVGQTIVLSLTAEDNVGIASHTLLVTPNGQTAYEVPVIDGVAVIEATHVGDIRLDYTVEDYVGRTLTTTLTNYVTVVDTANGPAAQFIGDLPGRIDSEPADVDYSVTLSTDEYYTIELVPTKASNSAIELVRVETPGAYTDSITIDPTEYSDGVYILRLTASDDANTTQRILEHSLTIESSSVGKVGNFSLSFTDLTLQFGSIPIQVQRVYDTLDARINGDFGYGWSLGMFGGGVQVNHSGSSDGEADAGLTSPFRIGTTVTLELPGGATESFAFQPVASDPLFDDLSMYGLSYGYQTQMAQDAAFTNLSGTQSTLKFSKSISLTQDADGVYLRGGAAFSPGYSSNIDYVLTTQDGTVYTFAGNTGKLKSIKTKAGATLTVNDPADDTDPGNAGGTVQTIDVYEPDNSSQSLAQVTIRRDAQDRVIKVKNSASSDTVTYVYDQSTGDLAYMQGRDGKYVAYDYTDANYPHYLTEIDSGYDLLDLSLVMSVDYTNDGRLDSINDASQGEVTITYDTFANGEKYEKVTGGPTVTEIIRDASGQQLLRQIQQLDSTHYIITVYEYDEDGRVTAESRPFQVEDTGSLNRFTAMPTNGWKTIRDYWDDDQLKYVTSDPGTDAEATTYYFYDDQGHLEVTVDALGNETRNEYDSETGRLLKTIDTLGTQTIYQYDDNGNLTSTIQTDASETQQITNSTSVYEDGVLVSSTRGGVTRYFGYDSDGNQTHNWTVWTDPDNASNYITIATVTEYDEEGRTTGTSQYELDGADITTFSALTTALGSATALWTTSTVYNDQGQVEQTTDRFGTVTVNLYNKTGQVVETRTTSLDENGNSVITATRTVYDEHGRTVATMGPVKILSNGTVITPLSDVRVTETLYDSLGRTYQTISSKNVAITLATDGDYYTTSFVTNPPYQVISTNTTVYDNSTGLVHHTISHYVESNETSITAYVYDEAGRQITVIQNAIENPQTPGEYEYVTGVSIKSETEYDILGRQTLTRDDAGHETRYEYDELGRQVAVITEAVDNPNQGAIEADMVYLRTETVYDAFGRRIEVHENLRQGAPGEEHIRRDQALITTYEYDDQGRLTAVNLPEITILDPDDPAGEDTITGQPRYEYRYDIYGNQIAITDNAFKVDTGSGTYVVHYYEKNSYGEDVSYTVNTGEIPDRSTVFTYDHQGRKLSRTLVGGETETFTYDEFGQLKLHKSFEDVYTFYIYDYNRNNTIDIDPTNGDNGKLVEKRYFTTLTSAQVDDLLDGNDANDPAASQTIAYTYDAFGRQLEIDDSLNHADQTNVYDGQGQLTRVETPQGEVNYEYDDQGRMTRTYTGDSDPTHTSQASDGKAVTDTYYTYDVFGRLKTVTVKERFDTPITDEVTTYYYDSVGNLDKVVLPNNVVSDYDYDELYRLESLTQFIDADYSLDYTSGETVLASYTYALNLDGTRSGATELILGSDNTTYYTNTFSWTYDELGRLIEENYDTTLATGDYTDIYSFDLVGNRLIKEHYSTNNGTGTPEVTTYIYDDNDRLLREDLESDSGHAGYEKTTYYIYNDTQQSQKVEMDLVTSVISNTVYSYDDQGRLEQVTIDADGNSHAEKTLIYTYNDSGIRVTQTEQLDTDDDGTVDSTTVTQFLIDANNHTGYAQVLEEKDGSGTVTKSYTIGHDVLAQAAAATAPLFLLVDGHGSTRQLIDNLAAVIQQFAYDAYGNMLDATHLTTATAALTTLLYSGEQTDRATGLQYLRARYYDPATGRFNRMDPFSGDLEDPQSLHKYLYTHANPIMGVDPSGEFLGTVMAIMNRIWMGGMYGSPVAGAFLAAKAEVSMFRGIAAGALLSVTFLNFGIGNKAAVMRAWGIGAFAAATVFAIEYAWDKYIDGDENPLAENGWKYGFKAFEAFSWSSFTGTMEKYGEAGKFLIGMGSDYVKLMDGVFTDNGQEAFAKVTVSRLVGGSSKLIVSSLLKKYMPKHLTKEYNEKFTELLEKGLWDAFISNTSQKFMYDALGKTLTTAVGSLISSGFTELTDGD